MSQPTLVVLGGYGNAGSAICRRLVSETEARVRIAGRHLDRAQRMADELNGKAGADRAVGVQADATDPKGLRRLLDGAQMVVAASSTARYAQGVAQAALDSGVDYLDIHVSTAKLIALRALEDSILGQGRCFITDAGFHPGLPAAMVRYLAPMFDRMERAEVASAIRQGWELDLSPSTVAELVEELADTEGLVYADGDWRSGRGMPRFTFGPPFGSQACFPMFLEEMRQVTEVCPALRQAGFYVTGFHWFVSYVTLPALLLGMKLAPGAKSLLGRFLRWSLRRFTVRPYGVSMLAEVSGEKSSRHSEARLELTYPDCYELTAIAVAACLLQYLDGRIRQPGLWLMGTLVEPNRLVADMARMGVKVSTTGKTSPKT